MSAFRKRGERVVHEGHVITLTVGEFEAPDGEVFHRDLVHHPGAVSVVPVQRRPDGGHDVVLVRQYRAVLEEDLLEIPAGKRDVAEEAPDRTAARELEEEAGLRAGRLELLGEFLNSPGFCDERSFVYLAEDLESVGPVAPTSLEEAAMSIERVDLDLALARISSREITDAKTIIGLLLAQRHLAQRGS